MTKIKKVKIMKNREVNSYEVVFETDNGVKYNFYYVGYIIEDLKNFLKSNFKKVEYEG